MIKDGKILVGKNKKSEVYLFPSMAQRHGLITGASGSGKTITSKLLAEGFSDLGVPVFMADVKGDLGGCAVPGDIDSIKDRLDNLKVKDFETKGYPVRYWDVYREKGHPIKASISSIGPSILSVMLGLSEAQEGVLDIIFKIAKDENMLLDDMKDLRIILQYVADNKNDYISKYGNITQQSVGVIQRSLLALENQGAELFFMERVLDINDLIAKDENGRGVINILDAVKLFNNPDLYVSFLLWILTELFTKLPEVGDLDKPKMVFFFDEAHLLFDGMPSYRLKQISQIVKLIRSKGVGLYFLSQKPTDIPDEIIGQLGNRVQHTLRAYTPAEQKVVKVAADSFRENPEFKTYDAILELGKGEALISFQTEKGEPSIVERVTILPPQSSMGTIDDMSRNKIINNSPIIGKYEEDLERRSAYEELTERNQAEQERKEIEKREIEEAKRLKEEEKIAKQKQKEEEKAKKDAERKKKNSVGYKTGKRVSNRIQSFFLTKALNAVWKKFFK